MTPPPPSPRKAWRDRIVPFTLLALAIAISIVVRVRLLDAPLDRDEGEHGYLARMLLAGHAPWQAAYSLRLPGTDALYAAAMAVFGQTARAIRILLLLIDTLTIFLVVLVGRRLFGTPAGALAGAAFALMACSQGVAGTIAHSPHFVIFFALWATLLALEAGGRSRVILFSGLLYGIAFLMKQPGLAFAVAGGLYLAAECYTSRLPIPASLKRGACFVAGVAVPYAALCLALWRAGTFPRFWFWTNTLVQGYASQLPLDVRLEAFGQGIAMAAGAPLYLWLLSAVGLILAVRNRATRHSALFLTAFAVLSFLAVSAGGTFRNNYFVFLLPAVALGCGALLAAGGGAIDDLTALVIPKVTRRRRAQLSFALPVVLAVLACISPVANQQKYLFRMTPYEFARSTFGLNPYPEAITIADYIRDHTKPDARLAILGSEAEIYFYAHRQAATGYLAMYPLMEQGSYALDCQKEVMREIESARPEYLVFTVVVDSWHAHATSPRNIYLWADAYTKKDFDIEGVIDIVPGVPARYVWGRWAPNYLPRSSAYLVVYHRRAQIAQ